MASRRQNTPPRSPAPPVTAPPHTPPEQSASSADRSSPATAPPVAPAGRKPRAKKADSSTQPIQAVAVSLEISADERRGMIAEAAYLRAERRGFSGGPDKEREDWLLAELEVDALLKAGHGSSRQ